MEIFRRDSRNKWTTEKGIQLNCGNHINYKYNGKIVSGTVEYSEMWNGGYYLILDNNEGSLPMFGNEIQAEVK